MSKDVQIALLIFGVLLIVETIFIVAHAAPRLFYDWAMRRRIKRNRQRLMVSDD